MSSETIGVQLAVCQCRKVVPVDTQVDKFAVGTRGEFHDLLRTKTPYGDSFWDYPIMEAESIQVSIGEEALRLVCMRPICGGAPQPERNRRFDASAK
jgi:hypothetical protein